MQIQVNTDGNVEGREELVEHVSAEIKARLGRFGDQVTRYEVHLGDESAGRSTSSDMRCMIEARPARRGAVAVTCHAASLHEAVSGAVEKLAHLLAREFGRRDHRKGGASIRGGIEVDEATARGTTDPDGSVR